MLLHLLPFHHVMLMKSEKAVIRKITTYFRFTKFITTIQVCLFLFHAPLSLPLIPFK